MQGNAFVHLSFLTRVSFRGLNGWDIVLNTHLHLLPRLRMCGAIPLLPIYAFIVCTGATLLFTTVYLLSTQLSLLDRKCFTNNSLLFRYVLYGTHYVFTANTNNLIFAVWLPCGWQHGKVCFWNRSPNLALNLRQNDTDRFLGVIFSWIRPNIMVQ